MKRKIGFGIIGAGMIAELHAKTMKTLKNVELIGIFDTNAAAAEKRAEQFQCRAYTDFDEFLADPAIEAVTIATPSGMHGKVAIPAAKAGKHILCEKPLEITLEKVDEVIKACGMTTDEFYKKVADAYRAYWKSEEWLQEDMSYLDKSIGAISQDNVTPFILNNGNAGAAGLIYTDSQFPGFRLGDPAVAVCHDSCFSHKTPLRGCEPQISYYYDYNENGWIFQAEKPVEKEISF